MYVYDCNTILTTEMKNRSDKEIIRDFTSLTEYLKIRGINTGFHFMDNEASTALKMTMTSMKIKYKLVPPSNNRTKSAYRAIQTFKSHFIAGLYSADKEFHLQLWDRMLQQETIRLNLLRKSRTFPYISDYTKIFRELDLNRTPLAPPGTRVVLHNIPNDRA